MVGNAFERLKHQRSTVDIVLFIFCLFVFSFFFFHFHRRSHAYDRSNKRLCRSYVCRMVYECEIHTGEHEQYFAATSMCTCWKLLEVKLLFCQCVGAFCAGLCNAIINRFLCQQNKMSSGRCEHVSVSIYW